MQLYSTGNSCLSEGRSTGIPLKVSFQEAVLKGLAADGGLYMPESIPALPDKFFQDFYSMSFQEIALEVSRHLLSEDIPEAALKEIIYSALNFEVPLIQLEPQISVLELFHGPTLAFKDFAARFMARLMSYFIQNTGKQLTILVATSGDTGSAVAHGFLKMPGIQVFILYPAGMVSEIQEKQLTTMGENITALEVAGTFDDCQRLVKQAFVDPELSRTFTLTSANSINIARLIPQSFYYFYAYSLLRKQKQSGENNKPIVFAVPSGNFGNITAGAFAKKMGLPIKAFIAAVNANDVVPKYLESREYQPQTTIKTISNAMDVGDPSNFTRLLELYKHEITKIRGDFWSISISDEETRATIQEVFKRGNYLLDPHGAVGYSGLKRFLAQAEVGTRGVVLATAHPIKFVDVIKPLVDCELPIPKQLESHLHQSKDSIPLANSFSSLKKYLLDLVVDENSSIQG